MSDDTTTETTEATDAPVAEAPAEAPVAPTPTSPVPDTQIREPIAQVEPTEDKAPAVVQSIGEVPAKGTGAPLPRPETVPVHEVVIHSDTVITDPNHPLAVQPGPHVNDLTPIGAAGTSGEHPETAFTAPAE